MSVHVVSGMFGGCACGLGLLLIEKVLAFYGVHPVVPLDAWCYWLAILSGGVFVVAIVPTD